MAQMSAQDEQVPHTAPQERERERGRKRERERGRERGTPCPSTRYETNFPMMMDLRWLFQGSLLGMGVRSLRLLSTFHENYPRFSKTQK